MKKKQLLFILGLSSVMTYAQKRFILPQNIAEKPKINEQFSPSHLVPSVPLNHNRSLEEILCIQKYDLQTYNSMPNRVVNYGNGNISAGWMTGNDENGYPDRGTGCSNKKNSGAWSNFQRVEGDGIRSGFPSFTGLSDGTDVAITHQNTNSPPYNLRLMKRTTNATSWTSSFLPISKFPSNSGYVWPVITSGGADGKSLHVIAVNNDPTTARQLHYFRSQDGGNTWDISEKVLSGLDTSWLTVGAQTYNIDARGNTVAIGVFDSWGDVTILKSTDNGNTWNKYIALDFPLDNYITDSGYEQKDILSKHDTIGTQPLAIFTSDGCGNVHIDKNGKVHVFFGNAFVIDENLSNSSTEYFTNVSGISYWNESFGKDSIQLIADLIDEDGDGIFTTNGTIPNYFGHALTSFPTSGSDNQGNLFMCYTSVADGFYSDDQDAMYRHIFIISSKDGGKTWSNPYDVINKDLVDNDLLKYMEAVYPSIARNVDDKIHLVYQQDYAPDASVINTQIAVTDNNIVYLGINTSLLLVGYKEIELSKTPLLVSPNPTNNLMNIQFESIENEQSILRINDLNGKLIYQEKLVNNGNSKTIDIHSLNNGIYSVQIITTNKMQVGKFVKM